MPSAILGTSPVPLEFASDVIRNGKPVIGSSGSPSPTGDPIPLRGEDCCAGVTLKFVDAGVSQGAMSP